MKRIAVKMEYLFKASPTIIYKFLTSPACLVRWFCDTVDIEGEIYTFSWEGSDEVAELVHDIEDERLRFRWEDAEYDDEYLEFFMYKSEITDETVLEIVDFADEDEGDELRELWATQVNELMHEIGG